MSNVPPRDDSGPAWPVPPRPPEPGSPQWPAPPPPPPPTEPFAPSGGASSETPVASRTETYAPPVAPPPTPDEGQRSAAAPGPSAGAEHERALSPRDEETEPRTRAVTPRWVTPLVVLAALALFAGGAMAGWAVAERDDEPSDPSPVAEQARDETTPVSGPVADGVEEPVAEVAEAVAPSVVQIETDAGLGSGIVYDDQGHILTAAHVVDGASQVRVRLADGTLVPAEITGTNAATDVGVVAVEPRDDMQPATLGLGVDVGVGQLAVAVGSPFGLEQTVTSGIISAIDRPVETGRCFDDDDPCPIVGMIQTDASINPGNSGGALADRNGRVIGINDAIRTAGGGNEGVGFAIPIDIAARVADQIIAGEEIRAGQLGVMVGDPTSGPAGALISEVMDGSPAEEAGLEVGDLITAVDGDPITQTASLRAQILATEPGTTVVLDVLREDEEIEIEVTLGSATG